MANGWSYQGKYLSGPGFSRAAADDPKWNYDVTKDTDVPQVQTAPSDLRGKLMDLLGTINESYNMLIQGGRDNDAFALRDAVERMQAAGSELGVNSWARAQAINDLQARLAAAGKTLEGTLTAQKLNATQGLLKSLADYDQADLSRRFSEGMQVLAAREAKLRSLEDRSAGRMAATNAWRASQSGQIPAGGSSIPASTLKVAPTQLDPLGRNSPWEQIQNTTVSDRDIGLSRAAEYKPTTQNVKKWRNKQTGEVKQDISYPGTFMRDPTGVGQGEWKTVGEQPVKPTMKRLSI